MPDLKEAVRWYRRAAINGLPLAQLNLGLAYEKGQGVDQDVVEAWAWLRAAADHGSKAAVPELERLQTQLTASQLETAKLRSGELNRRQ